MNKTVNEVARVANVSVRTLHYYDEIGLLRPSALTDSGYRLYDEQALERLQQILFFRELDFPLCDIKRILENPSFNRREALEKHRSLLMLKRKRLDALIGLVDDSLKGEKTMSFKEFDTTEIENAQKQYAEEVKERWGSTDAYTESTKRTGNYNKEDWARITAEGDAIFKAFSQHLGEDSASPAVQKLVGDWQNHITKYYYSCTKEILAGLGEMYTADERFTKNMDKYGAGTAKLMSEAIRVYCAE
ncbi:MerR family transcriptional regulator [Acetanaerobacterium elongatum]|uniref:Transcriptional regulator, MerR family n=1 Tax=Acetanaerobacterium elongatum TaxID=258515 RepID=A0A1G9XDX4_9FIRM|nr:MerR family transcriptional regulator [Acetanaerobacterium elongatum]SDM94485.1 transcriptional regulator, MerR family [Acetanaerobacterium elongatum]